MLLGWGSRAYMTLSTGLRTFSGLIVFVVLARMLGPKVYGLFAITFTYASLASLMSDYGLGIQLPQRIGAEPAKAGTFLGEALQDKTCLVGFGVVLLLIPLFLAGIGAGHQLAICLIVFSVILNGYADLLLAGLRSAGHFSRETHELAASTAILSVLLGAGFLLTSDLLWSSGMLFVAKLAHLGMAFAAIHRSGIKLEFGGGASRVLSSLRSGVPYAVDSVLTVLSSQIDVILVSQVFGLEATGLYQVGSRVVLGGISLAGALTGVHLPKAAAMKRGEVAAYLTYERRMMFEYFALGVLFAVALQLAGPMLVWGVLGPSYTKVNLLWPGFSAFVLMRFAAAGLGTCFLVRARLGLRIVNQIVGVGVTAALILMAGQIGDLVGAPWAIAGGAAAMVLVYAVAYFRLRNS